MKVATFSLERTVHSHFFTPKTSSGTSISMSCLTATWQDRRSPQDASRLVICDSSVGRIEPPPEWMRTRHCAQVPPPPQAEGTKSFSAARVWSSLPPAGTEMVFSPLMVMLTSPELTSFDRAAMMIITSAVTIRVKRRTPSPKVSMVRASPYSLTPLKDMKAMAISPAEMNVMPRP